MSTKEQYRVTVHIPAGVTRMMIDSGDGNPIEIPVEPLSTHILTTDNYGGHLEVRRTAADTVTIRPLSVKEVWGDREHRVEQWPKKG